MNHRFSSEVSVEAEARACARETTSGPIGGCVVELTSSHVIHSSLSNGADRVGTASTTPSTSARHRRISAASSSASLCASTEKSFLTDALSTQPGAGSAREVHQSIDTRFTKSPFSHSLSAHEANGQPTSISPRSVVILALKLHKGVPSITSTRTPWAAARASSVSDALSDITTPVACRSPDGPEKPHLPIVAAARKSATAQSTSVSLFTRRSRTHPWDGPRDWSASTSATTSPSVAPNGLAVGTASASAPPRRPRPRGRRRGVLARRWLGHP